MFLETARAARSAAVALRPRISVEEDEKLRLQVLVQLHLGQRDRRAQALRIGDHRVDLDGSVVRVGNTDVSLRFAREEG